MIIAITNVCVHLCNRFGVHTQWEGGCIYSLHEIIIATYRFVCVHICKSWLYDLGYISGCDTCEVDEDFLFFSVWYKYSVSCLPFAAGLCRFSVLNNQDPRW